MRKLTQNEVIELRACKEMDDGRMEFFKRARKFYEDDPEAVARVNEMEDIYTSVQEIPFMNGSAYGAYMKSMEMYYQKMDDLLKDMGYTSK